MSYIGSSHIPLVYFKDQIGIILFGHHKYDIYMDSGGHAEINENPIETASREGREESLNTFDIDINNMANFENIYNINNVVEYKNYYAFFNMFDIQFESIKSIYDYNKEIIYNNITPDHWKESKDISIFSIDSLINGTSKDGNYYKCEDMYGVKKIIFHRPIKYIIKAIKQKIFKNINNKWIFNKQIIKNVKIIQNLKNNMVFLNNTFSIITN